MNNHQYPVGLAIFYETSEEGYVSLTKTRRVRMSQMLLVSHGVVLPVVSCDR